MEEFDEYGIKDDPLPTDFNIASWCALGIQREKDLRAMTNADTPLSQQLGLRYTQGPDDIYLDNPNEPDPIVDPKVHEFLDIGREPFIPARVQARKVLSDIDEDADILLPPAITTS
jgi:hypothetical protein